MKTHLLNTKRIKSIVVGAMLVLTAFTSKAQCIADFTFTTGASGLVTVNNTSVGTAPPITSYYWQFGDGSIAWGNSASNTYTANGTYGITLFISDTTINCSDSITYFVTVSNASGITPCVASFKSYDSLGVTSFASTSIGTDSSTVYNWTFGDGTLGAGEYNSHTYVSPGYYIVSLQIINQNLNCNNTYTDTILVGIVPPVCTANANFIVYQDSSVALTWNVFPVFASTTQTAIWSWGDGSTTTALYPSHVYSAAGIYTICLTITDSCGATDTMCTNQSIFRYANASAITVNVVNQISIPLAINNKLKTSKVSIYPNPSNGNISIVSSLNGNYTIVNEIGQIVETFTTNLNNNYSFNVNNLKSGMYFLIGNTSNGQTHQKIVVTQ
jgi:PKD repeat protein